jgi:hypothetical protein
MRKVHFKYINPLVSVLVFFLALSSCQKDLSTDGHTQGQANLHIKFDATVDGSNLIFGKSYKNAFDEEYSIKTFKFYIHGIELMNSQTNTAFTVDKDEYWLINAADSSTLFVKLRIAPSAYNRIRFIIGVDSIRNVSGAQTGALDPAQGMFWTWSTGYIMAKLEGNSPVAKTPNNVIEYHIGGFKSAESVLRKITLDFPILQKLDIKQGSLSTITITANISRWFSPGNPIRISQNPVSMTPGTLATQIADNYSGMFTVAEIVNE